MGTIKFLGGITFAVIFAIVIVSYAVNFGNDNNAQVNLNQDSELSSISSGNQQELADFKTTSDEATNILLESTVADDNIEGGGSFKTTPTNVLDALGSIMNVTTNRILGGREGGFGFIPTTILAFFGMMATLYIWKTWKGGNPD